jgi:hypothetical protein
LIRGLRTARDLLANPINGTKKTRLDFHVPCITMHCISVYDFHFFFFFSQWVAFVFIFLSSSLWQPLNAMTAFEPDFDPRLGLSEIDLIGRRQSFRNRWQCCLNFVSQRSKEADTQVNSLSLASISRCITLRRHSKVKKGLNYETRIGEIGHATLCECP